MMAAASNANRIDSFNAIKKSLWQKLEPG